MLTSWLGAPLCGLGARRGSGARSGAASLALRRARRASPSWVFSPAVCANAQTPTCQTITRLIIDKRKTLPRKLVSNRTAPATPSRSTAAPLPSPRALRSQLPTRCHSQSWAPGLVLAGMQPSDFHMFKGVSWWLLLAFLPGSASQEEALFGCGGSRFRERRGGSGIPVPSGCCSETPAERGGRDGEEGTGRRPAPALGLGAPAAPGAQPLVRWEGQMNWRRGVAALGRQPVSQR